MVQKWVQRTHRKWLAGSLIARSLSFGLLRLAFYDGFHCGEEEDFLDVDVVGKEHDESVDSETPATSGWECVLEAVAEVLIV